MSSFNERNQSVMYVVFRFGTYEVISAFMEAFARNPSDLDILRACLVKKNNDKNEDLPLVGLLVRGPSDPQRPPTVAKVLQVASKCMEITSDIKAVLPLKMMLKNEDNNDNNNC